MYWMMQKRNRSSGFSIIELMFVVAIVGLLATIALPQFQAYRHRARAAEVGSIMAGISVSQETFALSHDAYADITTANPAGALSPYKRPWDFVACDPGCSRTNVAACTSFDCIGFVPDGWLFYQYVSPANPSPPEFAIGAVGDVDGNNVPGSYSFQSNHTTSFGLIGDGISSCPVGIPSGAPFHCTPFEF
jgi:type IV pilus assembly protein PilA